MPKIDFQPAKSLSDLYSEIDRCQKITDEYCKKALKDLEQSGNIPPESELKDTNNRIVELHKEFKDRENSGVPVDWSEYNKLIEDAKEYMLTGRDIINGPNISEPIYAVESLIANLRNAIEVSNTFSSANRSEKSFLEEYNKKFKDRFSSVDSRLAEISDQIVSNNKAIPPKAKKEALIGRINTLKAQVRNGFYDTQRVQERAEKELDRVSKIEGLIEDCKNYQEKLDARSPKYKALDEVAQILRAGINNPQALKNLHEKIQPLQERTQSGGLGIYDAIMNFINKYVKSVISEKGKNTVSTLSMFAKDNQEGANSGPSQEVEHKTQYRR